MNPAVRRRANPVSEVRPWTLACSPLQCLLAVLRLESGVPFHVAEAKQLGATREEVISAVLLGLQPGGHGVTGCLPAAIDAYDAADER